MPVVSFTELTPPARYNDLPWIAVRVEESSRRDGGWELVETVALAAEATPATPADVSLTVIGMLEQGFYRTVWIDADDNETATDPVPWPKVADITPTIEDVSALLRARTNFGGTERGAFDDDTRPNAEQVESLIAFAVSDLKSRIGEYVPNEYGPDARRLAALQAATLIEASFFPNELDSDRSAYRQYQAMYLNGVEALGKVGRTAYGVAPYVYVT